MLLLPKIKIIYTIGFLIIFRRFWEENHGWGSIGSRVGARWLEIFSFSIIFSNIRERLKFICCHRIGIKTIENGEKYYWKYIWRGFLDGGSMCFKTNFFRFPPPPPGEINCHSQNLRCSFSESHNSVMYCQYL